MNAYEYTVLNKDNERIDGILWAQSEEEVKVKLKLESYTICHIQQMKAKSYKWNHKAVVDICQQLGLLLKSGIPLRRALLLLCEQQSSLPYRSIYEGIQRGRNLSQALQQLGFPTIGLALLESGESAGTLGDTLQYISTYYDKERRWHQKIISAIAYPSFLLVMMNLFFLVTILFIIPSFSRVFATMNVELPMMTRGLFALGQSLGEHPLLYGGIHIVGICLLLVAYKQQSIYMKLHRGLWNLAQNKTSVTAFYYTNVLAIWALLLESGISIIQTIKITKSVWPNAYGRRCSDDVVGLLEKGYSFTQSLQSAHIGNPFIWQMVSVGEESGELAEMLRHCSNYYGSLMEQYITRLERLMEPLLLSIMGIGIAILVVSVMYPLFTSISNLSSQ
ncbi:type II secretion system F family protein [Veillonella agrestimuris]|uniref:type II secretion system F family protein n=1 Tax=Veillonella agrestimuris TaxID=2941340 RepID=UPI00203E57B6|nr:type II secretion system F family protein [Veillonella agrestimuris]